MKTIELFNIRKPAIGMIHVDALPGTPDYKGDVKNIINKARKESVIYKDAGIDAIVIENMHDVPYLKRSVGPEITALMSIVGYEVKNISNLPCGIQILAGANKEALAAAHSAGLDFIRAEGFVFAHVADEGLMESDAGKLLRYRKQIGADSVLIFTDIKKKHSSHSITSDVDIVETAKAAEFLLSDGIIITGKATGEEADIDEVKKVKEAVNIPVLIGSGVTIDNIEMFLPVADAFIIGSYFKQGGFWKNEVDSDRVTTLVKKIKSLKR
ncbi:putative sgc region protein SgcQ [bacterium BMS3Abin03]|nr:putative sgc region protein SgcQ [bacterium BMS3Abin03]HDZ58540.1 BtpA/SgcQ family protein [Ignavibacteriales bacterium]